MKRIISLCVVILMCAAIFVGCGSENKGATEPYSEAKFNMLHDETLPLNCSGKVLEERNYTLDESSDEVGFKLYGESIQKRLAM